MSRIPKNLREQVARRAKYRCEYCLVPERFLATIFHIDHIRSLKHGGLTTQANLAFTCPHCNCNKGSDVAAFADTEGEVLVRLFNPRKDVWEEHFYIRNGLILAKTTVAEATIRILAINEPYRVVFRKALAEAGKYP